MTQLPPFLANMAPIDIEVDIPSLPIHGSLPVGLEGRLLRNGPNPLHPKDGEHWFFGDGMLHEFGFGQGVASYRNRWVRTGQWLAQRAVDDDAQAPDVQSSVANTNVLVHAGRLMALEEAHLPLALDPEDLLGARECSFDGQTSGAFTAHPKIDPLTGEMVFFGYGNPRGLTSGMVYGTVDASGRVTRRDAFEAPYASMVHDFAVSQRHVVFPVMPLTASRARAAGGLPPFAWEPELACHIGVLRRDAPIDTLRWFALPACFVYHTVNAWDEGELLHVDVMQSAVPALFPMADGSPVTGDGNASLWRWTFDLAADDGAVSRRQLCSLAGEFPRIDERAAGLAYRHAWFVGDGEDGSPFSRIVHWDHQTQQPDVWNLPAEDCASEGVFVPRSAGSSEGDGWLLSVVYRGQQARSDLLVFDAGRLHQGPVATVSLPHRVPNGFHGNWIGAATPLRVWAAGASPVAQPAP